MMTRIATTIPEAIGNEVFLTYIGLGLPVAIPSLGNLINSGRLELKKLITHVYDLEHMDDAIYMQMSPESIKVVVHP